MSFTIGSALEKRGKWELLDGNPHPYLKALQRAANRNSVYSEDRIPKPKRKSEFDRFAAAAGARVPATFAFVENGEVSSGQSATRQTLGSFLRSLPRGHYFCKQDTGMQGMGALHLEILPAGLSVNGEERDLAFVEATLAARPYLIQEWLVPLQHELARSFNPLVVNSVRLVTFEASGKAEVVTGFFRSAIASRAVDNWNAGGVAVRVDLAGGVLAGAGILKNGDAVLAAHPVSGIVFQGHRVPHLREAIALVENLHSRLRAKSLGWDIALLEDGPAVLECNGTGWDLLIPSVLEPDFTEKFIDFHVPAHELGLSVEFTGDFRDKDRARDFLCKALGLSRVSGRLDRLSEQQINVTIAGARRSLNVFVAALKSPMLKNQFESARGKRSSEQMRRGLDLSVSFLDN